jgi:hypothetical protein
MVGEENGPAPQRTIPETPGRVKYGYRAGLAELVGGSPPTP